MRESSATYIQSEWAAFQAEPWGDDWRPLAKLISLEYKDVTSEQVLSVMLSEWFSGEDKGEQTDDEIQQLLEKRFGGKNGTS